jgi:hypothetical protein
MALKGSVFKIYVKLFTVGVKQILRYPGNYETEVLKKTINNSAEHLV